MKRKILPALSIMLILALAGCSVTNPQSNATSSDTASDRTDESVVESTNESDESSDGGAVYTMITPLQAKTIMEEQSNEIVLDVRTAEEFAEGHIKGAILLPNDEITSKAASMLPDKNQVILVYCRSGRRSALAANELVALGYTHVFDFGGIISWPYETVK